MRYWRAIARNKWRILALVTLVGLIATLYAYSLTPVYRSTATVHDRGFARTKAKGLSEDDLYIAYTGSSRDYYLTQFEIIKSRDFAERLVRVMGLTKHPEFDGSQAPKPWYAMLLPASQVAAGAASEGVPTRNWRTASLTSVMGRTSLQPVRNTQLVKISFDSGDPELAARVPNTLATIYIVADLESRMESTRRSTQFLAQQSERPQGEAGRVRARAAAVSRARENRRGEGRLDGRRQPPARGTAEFAGGCAPASARTWRLPTSR